jgi:Ran GTPase-activating protein (RanGAP) involved in mRNA processing and transport
MTKFDISSNNLRAEGGKSLAEGLKGNQVIKELNFSGNYLGLNYNNDTDTSGIIAIADVIPDMGAIASINLLNNLFPVEQAQELVKIMQAKENLTTLCGLSKEETELDFSRQNVGAGDAVLIANDISGMGALTSLNISNNNDVIGTLVLPEGVSLPDGWSGPDSYGIYTNADGNYANAVPGGQPIGVIALASAIKDMGALLVLSLNSNSLGVDGGKALADGLRGNNVLIELNISDNDLTNYGRDRSGVIALADVIKDMGAMTKFDISSNNIRAEGGEALAEGLKCNQVIKELNFSGNTLGHKSNGVSDTSGIIAIADVIPGMGALFSLNLSRNSIGADGVASITAALKRRAIEHQRPCISIRLGDQDQHLLARTKDLRALLVATSNLNPSHCMPAISDDLLKEIAEWL